jgi:hypothetical protein
MMAAKDEYDAPLKASFNLQVSTALPLVKADSEAGRRVVTYGEGFH